ncbi:MAG TPA: DUF4055 domain-containing protein [Clostridia bacterium]|nr:DUF4055 domain-containing protein [Clostridia bacterium]
MNSTHPEYEAALPAWVRARDVLAGEDAVKAAGEKYLPRMDSQSEEEYAAYKARASFFGATARTLEEYLDLVFRRAPALALGAEEKLKAFVADCDWWGLEFVRYARRVVGEVLGVGRAGSLVLWEQSGRPVVSLWRAEDIVDWGLERVDGRINLAYLALREGKRMRVFRLVEGACFHELLKQQEDGAWCVLARFALKRGDTPLPFIPFVFHGPRHSRPEPDKLPLGDIIAANLDHYRLDADFKHGLHFAALPTAWVSGFDKATPLRIGSSAAWVSDIPGASAGFLEFSGAGLERIERALEKVEKRMALLGARMLEVNGTDGEKAQRGELCGLGNVVASLNQSLSRVLQLAHWWVAGSDAAEVSFAMNADLSVKAMSGEVLTAVVSAWRSGAISRDSMLEMLKRGEVLPEGRTVAQERALIHRTGGSQ